MSKKLKDLFKKREIRHTVSSVNGVTEHPDAAEAKALAKKLRDNGVLAYYKKERIAEGKGAFADWARENKANKKADRERGRKEAHARHLAQMERIQKERKDLHKAVASAEHRGNQLEWEDAVANLATHQKKHGRIPELDESVHAPTTYLDTPHTARLNGILDQITGKYFVNLQTYVDAVRAALDFHGFKLPHLDCEQEIHGPLYPQAYGDLAHGPGFEDNRNTPGVPTEFEYIFQLKYDDSAIGSVGHPEEYLYMCANRVDEDGDEDGEKKYWETYAQVVTPEELADLADIADARTFPEIKGDASGETGYLRKQRHVNTTGTSPEDDIE